MLHFSSKKNKPQSLRIVDRGENTANAAYQEHVSSFCGPSCQILVQEPGKAADTEKIRGGGGGSCKDKLQPKSEDELNPLQWTEFLLVLCSSL